MNPTSISWSLHSEQPKLVGRRTGFQLFLSPISLSFVAAGILASFLGSQPAWTPLDFLLSRHASVWLWALTGPNPGAVWLKPPPICPTSL